MVVPNVAANAALPLSFTLGGVRGGQTLYIAIGNWNFFASVRMLTHGGSVCAIRTAKTSTLSKTLSDAAEGRSGTYATWFSALSTRHAWRRAPQPHQVPTISSRLSVFRVGAGFAPAMGRRT